jgi:hypothetical protein
MTTMNNSITDMRIDMNAATKSHDDKLALLEQKMVSKYDEMATKLELKHVSYENRIVTNTDMMAENRREIEALKLIVHSQQEQIT